jgi:hypothetical protein
MRVRVRTYCLARAIEADDNDGKLVLPEVECWHFECQEKRVSYLVRYS